MDSKELVKFKDYLEAGGAVMLIGTNPFELVRFKTKNGEGKFKKHIIYINKHGNITSYSSDEAYNAHQSFLAGKPFKGINRKRQQVTAFKKRVALRDGGSVCFFCGEMHSIEDLTIEHLLSVSHGGTDNINNFVLACEDCNKDAGNKSIAAKIRLRDEKRGIVHVRTS